MTLTKHRLQERVNASLQLSQSEKGSFEGAIQATGLALHAHSLVYSGVQEAVNNLWEAKAELISAQSSLQDFTLTTDSYTSPLRPQNPTAAQPSTPQVSLPSAHWSSLYSVLNTS